MAVLHLVTKSPYASDALSAALARAADGDCLLLIEDGVVGVGHPTLLAARGRLDVRVLVDDLAARGLAGLSLPDGVKAADYADFVAFACKYPVCVSWL